MQVSVLQQFLRSLVPPLRAAGAGESAATTLAAADSALEPFGPRHLAEFAQFLVRCQDYERQGHWPERRPAIAGALFDEPAPAQYVERLRQFLAREMPGGVLSAEGREELKKLEKALKPAVLQQIARAAGVAAPPKQKPQLMNQIVLHLTGHPLIAPKVKATRAKKAPAAAAQAQPAAGSEQVDRFADIIRALKAKAEMPGAPEEEIAAELRSLEQRMDRDTAVAVCARVGIVRPVKTQQEAFEALRRKVFEMKRAQEINAY